MQLSPARESIHVRLESELSLARRQVSGCQSTGPHRVEFASGSEELAVVLVRERALRNPVRSQKSLSAAREADRVWVDRHAAAGRVSGGRICPIRVPSTALARPAFCHRYVVLVHLGAARTSNRSRPRRAGDENLNRASLIFASA